MAKRRDRRTWWKTYKVARSGARNGLDAENRRYWRKAARHALRCAIWPRAFDR